MKLIWLVNLINFINLINQPMHYQSRISEKLAGAKYYLADLLFETLAAKGLKKITPTKCLDFFPPILKS